MGNHWGSGRDKESAGPCAVTVRALAASATVALSLFALGIPGTPVQPGTPPAPRGAGSVGLPLLAGGFQTDSRALVAFSRTIVTTTARDGHAKLNVASAALRRPPEGFLMSPLEALRSSSPFGFRISPISGAAGDFHLGQDYAAGCGTRVYSADAGVVRAAGWHPWGGGNRVEIDHGNGLITTYNHLEAIAVRTGDSVQVGQVIARVGTTGWSTGCHLHFETILHGKHTSPLNWTLLPTRQLDELGDIVMVNYDGKATAAPRWAIPVAHDHSHAVLNGEQELTEAPQPDPAPTTGLASGAVETATPSPTATGVPTATGSPTEPVTAEPSTTAEPTTEEPAPTAEPTTEEPAPTAEPGTEEPAPTAEPGTTEPGTTEEPAPMAEPSTTEPGTTAEPTTTEEPAPTAEPTTTAEQDTTTAEQDTTTAEQDTTTAEQDMTAEPGTTEESPAAEKPTTTAEQDMTAEPTAPEPTTAEPATTEESITTPEEPPAADSSAATSTTKEPRRKALTENSQI